MFLEFQYEIEKVGIKQFIINNKECLFVRHDAKWMKTHIQEEFILNKDNMSLINFRLRENYHVPFDIERAFYIHQYGDKLILMFDNLTSLELMIDLTIKNYQNEKRKFLK